MCDLRQMHNLHQRRYDTPQLQNNCGTTQDMQLIFIWHSLKSAWTLNPKAHVLPGV